MGTCNGKNNLPNSTQIVQRLQFASLKANLRPQETSLSNFCFLPLCHFFSGPRISLLSQNQVAATRTLSACEQALRFGGNGVLNKSREEKAREKMEWVPFAALPPALPPTSIFFASNFFLSYPSMEPNPRLTLYFVGMKKMYAKHCWLVVLVHVKLTLLVSTAVTCPQLSVISNGGLLPSSCTSSGGKYQNKCSYYCSSGYTLQGGQFRVCQADGTWDGTAPTCKKRTEYICFLFLRFDFLNIFNIIIKIVFLYDS